MGFFPWEFYIYSNINIYLSVWKVFVFLFFWKAKTLENKHGDKEIIFISYTEQEKIYTFDIIFGNNTFMNWRIHFVIFVALGIVLKCCFRDRAEKRAEIMEYVQNGRICMFSKKSSCRF